MNHKKELLWSLWVLLCAGPRLCQLPVRLCGNSPVNAQELECFLLQIEMS